MWIDNIVRSAAAVSAVVVVRHVLFRLDERSGNHFTSFLTSAKQNLCGNDRIISFSINCMAHLPVNCQLSSWPNNMISCAATVKIKTLIFDKNRTERKIKTCTLTRETNETKEMNGRMLTLLFAMANFQSIGLCFGCLRGFSRCKHFFSLIFGKVLFRCMEKGRCIHFRTDWVPCQITCTLVAMNVQKYFGLSSVKAHDGFWWILITARKYQLKFYEISSFIGM